MEHIANSTAKIGSRMKKFKFVLDVDGVLSTGQFLYSDDGKSFKVFGPHDADGLALIKDQVEIKFISADKRGYHISEKRVADMGFPIELVSGDRLAYLKKNYDLETLFFMGDGIHDAPVLKACKFGIAPNNARAEAIAAADYVTPSRAAEGAVCDACLEIQKRFLTES